MARTSGQAPAANGIVTLLTDFGSADAFAGIMKGMMLRVNPRARLVDLTHEIPPHDIVAGALVLRSATPYFPRATVHLAVVDPGVGSTRRAVAIATDTATFVGPDNGLLIPALRQSRIRTARAIDIAHLQKRKLLGAAISQTFHGRDVFAPVAAWLSKGGALSALGPAANDLVELRLPVSRVTDDALDGEVIYVDRFGNLVTNVTAEDLTRFRRRTVSVSIAGMRIGGLVSSYASVADGELLAIIGSWDLLEIAAHGANAAQRLAAGRGTSVRIAAE
ncbi:MAG TPA: SAM-dependent chlorinase/fluorinase [Candidatus Kryptonia bacterium]|nr:SAM-dependent chlorinase/fluorinase [Candidatus Kryptonia bacterium]